VEILNLLQGKAEAAEAYAVTNEAMTVRFEAGRLKTAETQETSGLAVRLVKAGRIGAAATTDMQWLEELARNALASAEHGEEAVFSFAPPKPATAVEVCSKRVASLGMAELVEMGREMVETVRAAEDDINIIVEIAKGIHHVRIANTLGQDVETSRTPLSIDLAVERVRENDVLFAWEYDGTTHPSEIHRAMAAALAEKLESAKRSASARSGKMPVVFSPSGALLLFLPIMEGLSGKSAWRETSPMAHKVGERVFSENLTVIDDGTLDERPSSSPFDGEGVPTQRNVLIENGVLKSFYYDLKTAAQAGTVSTGNASRGVFGPPRPGVTSLLVPPGDTPLADIIGGIEEGLLVEGFLGMGQGNVISGAFGNSVSLAYKIKRGEVVGRVKDVTISGNIYEDLKHIEGLSDTSKWCAGMLNTPHILLADVTVAARGEG
jgi:PmbA protein